MDRAEHVSFARRLLERAEYDRREPVAGAHLAARWASGAFACLLMAHASDEDIATGPPAPMYSVALRLDREDGGGERWRRMALAACDITHGFHFDGLRAGELERKTSAVVQGCRELLARLDPGAPSP